jgi:hypothetical protein
MMQTRRTSLAAVLALTLVSAPSIARGDSWMPLAPGTQWEYANLVGDVHEVQTITGQRTVRGRVVAVKSYSVGPDAGLENFWLLDADGSVLLAGFMNPSVTLALAYEPPIRFLAVPPATGPQPVQHIVAHDLLTDAVVNEFDVQLAQTLAQVSVPFLGPTPVYATGVARISPPAGQALAGGTSLTLDGRPLPSGSAGSETDWFLDLIGEVLYLSSDQFGLTAFGLPTPTVKTSWGAIKRLYH